MTLIFAVIVLTVCLVLEAFVKMVVRNIKKAQKKKRNKSSLPPHVTPTEYMSEEELDNITVIRWNLIPVIDYDVK